MSEHRRGLWAFLLVLPLWLAVAGCGTAPLGNGFLSGAVPSGWVEVSPGRDLMLSVHDGHHTPLWIEVHLTGGNGGNGEVAETWKAVAEEERPPHQAVGDLDTGTERRKVRVYRRRVRFLSPEGKRIQKVMEAVADRAVDQALVEEFLGGLVQTNPPE